MVGKVTPNTMLSASRVPALLGHSKYETPNDVLKSVLNALQDVETPFKTNEACLLYTSPSPRDRQKSRMPSSA